MSDALVGCLSSTLPARVIGFVTAASISRRDSETSDIGKRHCRLGAGASSPLSFQAGEGVLSCVVLL